MSMSGLPDLRTARLHLRVPVMDDAPALAAAIDDYDVAKWLSVVPHPYTLADAEWFIGEITAGRLRGWLIDDGALAGVVGLDDELGYWLAPRAQGRGYATEAATAVLDWAFAGGAEEVTSGHFLDNARSARVLEKLGFRPTGLRAIPCRARGHDMDSRRMVLSRADWLERKAAIR